MKISLRSTLLGGAAIAASALLASASHAGVNPDSFSGGGSSLAGPTYINVAKGYQNSVPTFFLNYGTSGSGPGASAFISNVLSLTFPGETLNDDFAGSDSFLSQAQINLWGSTTTPGTSGTPIFQIPTFATPITLAFNIPGVTTDGGLSLNDNDLLLIFSGQVTTWGDSRLSTPLTGANATLAVHPVYRSDNSGTSFIFTTHLANVVSSAITTSGFGLPIASPSNVNFNITGLTFPPASPHASVFTGSFPTGTQTFTNIFTSGGVPTNFIPGSGSGGVEAQILSTPGAVGYLSPDYTDIASINAGRGFPSVAGIALGTTKNYVTPTKAAVSAVLGPIPLATTADQLKNVWNFSPLFPLPTVAGGYPIAGFTYLFFSQCYAPAVVAQSGNSSTYNPNNDISSFISTLYTSASTSNLVTQNGFVPLNSTGGLGKQVITYLLQNTAIGGVTADVNIGNSNASIVNADGTVGVCHVSPSTGYVQAPYGR